MTKLDDTLIQAIAGKAREKASAPELDRGAIVGELVKLVTEAIRAAQPDPPAQVVVQPATRTAWRFRFVRREGLLEEIVAIPIDPKDVNG